ncbi:MAG: pitrilysin family protein [bacterium]|nr:pitrilysin family protein [bacterium]
MIDKPPLNGNGTLIRETGSGLRVIVRRDPAVPVVTVWVWVGVGSVNEPDGSGGVSHVIEHMAFKGTPTRGVGEISREIESHGGFINAFTGYYATAYFVSLPRKHAGLGIEVLADALSNPLFDPAELARELEVVGEEIRMRDDQPDTRLWESAAGQVYTVHRMGRSVGGHLDVVKAFTRDQVLDYHRRHYTPRNSRVVVVGDGEPETIFSEVERRFSAYDHPFREPDPAPPEPEQLGPRFRVEEMPVNRAHLALAWPTPGQLHPDTPSLDILTGVAGDGLSSRLYRRVKDELNLVDDISASLVTGDDAGIFYVECELDPADVRRALAAILGEAALLRERPAGAYELNRVRNTVELSYLQERETVEGQAHELAHYDHLGDWRRAEEYLRGLYAVSAESVLGAAGRYLAPEKLSVALVVPRGRAAELQNLEHAADRSSPPPVRRPLAETPPRPVSPSPVSVEETVLGNGVRLVLRRNTTRALASVAAFTAGGLFEEPTGLEGVTNFALEMALRGTSEHDAEEFHARVEYYGAELDTDVQRDFYGFELDCAARHLDPGLALLAETLTRPAFPESELEPKRSDILAEIATRTDEASAYTLGRVNTALYAGRGYGRFLDGRDETVRALDAAALTGWYGDRLRADRLVIGVSGAFERDPLLERLEELFGGLPKGDGAPDAPPRVYGTDCVEERLPKQQTHVALAFPAPALGDDRRFAANVLAQGLNGAGRRLFIELRDRLHLAYVVFFLYRPLRGAGGFFSYIATQTERGEEALDALRGELDRVAREGLDPTEVAEAKEHVIGLYQLGRQRNAASAASYAGAVIQGLTARDVDLYPERIARVTPDEVNAVAAESLDPSRGARCVIRGTMPDRKTR